MAVLSLQRQTEVIAAVKHKKELQHLDDAFVGKQLTILLRKKSTKDITAFLNASPRSEIYKKTIKELRALLRRQYGLFRSEESTPHISFEHCPPADIKKKVSLLLQNHSSTSERVEYYPQLYNSLQRITGPIQSVLDLGCGLNPLSLIFWKKIPERYSAYDLSTKEIKLLDQFFHCFQNKNPSFQGKAAVHDITDISFLKQLPFTDVSFLFKMTDILDQNKGHKKTEEILNAIPAHYVVISFPTVTMSGKRMTAPRRSWMEWLCQRLKYNYDIIELKNEIFYVVEK
ncbi:TPA: hypothetical protein HA241_03210 [Candidatus Woesearchaeota archaeon]|nr:hypothetical protein [Candidatus Woesearchaeota archaeon]